MGAMEVSELAKTIKANVLRILKEQDVSQNELARRIGTYSGGISRLLNADCELQTDTIQKIADALSVSTIELTSVLEHAAH